MGIELVQHMSIFSRFLGAGLSCSSKSCIQGPAHDLNQTVRNTIAMLARWFRFDFTGDERLDSTSTKLIRRSSLVLLARKTP
jgi:hypothetical protein